MKVALLASDQWLEHERAMLRRIIVGLVDEMVRIVRIAPEPQADRRREPWLLTAESVWYTPGGWPWLRDRQLRRLAGSLREREIDLVHALDGSLEHGGSLLADALGVPLLCSIWSQAEIQCLRGSGHHIGRGYLAASRGLQAALRKRIAPPSLIECIAPGVYASTEPPAAVPLARAPESICCVVAGNGRYDGYYRALLAGIARCRADLRGVMYFFYSTHSDQHALWQAAERMNLLEHISLVPASTDARQLVPQADVLLQPQPLRAVATIALEAMAAGRPVIAASDGLVDHLVDGVTARVIEEPDAGQWAACLLELATAPARWVELAQSARQYILTHHRASAFAGGLRHIYERMAVPQAIPFG